MSPERPSREDEARPSRRSERPLVRFGKWALWGIVAISVLASCALLVYLGALLLARLVVRVG